MRRLTRKVTGYRDGGEAPLAGVRVDRWVRLPWQVIKPWFASNSSTCEIRVDGHRQFFPFRKLCQLYGHLLTLDLPRLWG